MGLKNPPNPGYDIFGNIATNAQQQLLQRQYQKVIAAQQQAIAHQQFAELEEFIRRVQKVDPAWKELTTMSDTQKNTPSLLEPMKIVMTCAAFINVPIEKKKILFELKKRTASQVVAEDRQTVIWFFDAATLLDVVKQYSWILDKNLGEKEDTDALFNAIPNYGRTPYTP